MTTNKGSTLLSLFKTDIFELFLNGTIEVQFTQRRSAIIELTG